MAPHWIGNVANSGHVAVKLRHWAVLLDLLSERPLGAEGLVRGHLWEGRPNRRFSQFSDSLSLFSSANTRGKFSRTFLYLYRGLLIHVNMHVLKMTLNLQVSKPVATL